MGSLAEDRGRLALVCAAAALIVAGLAALDYERTTGEVPPLPPPCPVQPADAPPLPATLSPALCQLENQERLEQRYYRSNDLEQGYQLRMVLYAVLITGIGVAYLLARRSALPPGERRSVYTDLGMGGIGLLAASIAILVLIEGGLEPFDPSIVLTLAPAIALLVIAAAGSVVTLPEMEPDPEGPRGASGVLHRIPLVVVAGLVMMVLALCLSTVAVTARGPCEDPPPDWTDTAFWIATVCALGAAACGLVGLAMRRWFSALLLIGLAPVWVFASAFASACLD